MKKRVIYEDLGLIQYEEGWKYQQSLHDGIKATKLANRKKAVKDQKKQEHYFLICVHEPVFTLGKSGSIDHLLLSEDLLKEKGFSFFKINRGGDITYHGPGQIVGYPILDLDCFFTDVHQYVRYIEEIIIRTLSDFGIVGTRINGFTGVWIEGDENRPNRKVCAIGVHLSRWVTMHGFALNVNTNLSHFNYIVPCGISSENKTVTSMAMELGQPLDEVLVKERLKHHFTSLFECELVSTIAAKL